VAFAALAAITFLAAFALAARGGNDLTGPDAPALTTASLPVLGSSVGKLPTTSQAGPTTTAPTSRSSGFVGVTPPVVRTTTSTTRASTTTRGPATTRATTTTTRVVTTTTIPPTTTTTATPATP
jgi:hypothetical protein